MKITKIVIRLSGCEIHIYIFIECRKTEHDCIPVKYRFRAWQRKTARTDERQSHIGA